MHNPSLYDLYTILCFLQKFFLYDEKLLDEIIDMFDPLHIWRSLNTGVKGTELLIALIRSHAAFGNYDMYKIVSILSNFVDKIEEVDLGGWKDVEGLYVAAANMKIWLEHAMFA